jgi:NAD+ synthase
MHMRADEIAAWLRERVVAAGAQGLVVGLSGGIDSAVVAGLAQQAVGEQAIGLILPCHSDPQDETDARLVADHVGMAAVTLDLAPAFDLLASGLQGALAQIAARQPRLAPAAHADVKAQMPVVNIKPRLRMAALYFVANSLNCLVAGTGNRCELAIGYFTKYGDGGVDVLPLGDLTKSEVRALAVDLRVPEAILRKPPSAGLWPGQTDEAEMGFTYEDMEKYLRDGPEGVAPALALRIERLVRQSEHKRTAPPTPLGRAESE